MRRLIIAMVMAFVLVLGTAGTSSAGEVPPQGCIINILGVKVCGELLTPLPTVTVTVKPPPVRVTVNVPGPTRTVTIPGLPGATQTVPGPTVTKTVAAIPGPTVGPGQPQSTVTQSVTVSQSGQPIPTRGTLGPGDTGEHKPSFITLDSPGGVARTVGFGLLSILALLAIVLGGMYYGFHVGRRSQMDEDTNFMREVLDSAKSRGKHS